MDTVEEYAEAQETMTAIAVALVAVLDRLKQAGLSDCAEFDQGCTALRRLEAYHEGRIDRLGAELKRLTAD